MKFTSVFWKNARANTRFVINQGGTSSSKTHSLLQLMYLKALNRSQQGKSILISVLAGTMPHLRRGAMRDFLKMLQTEGVYDESAHNRSEDIYRVGNSQIEFFSADDAAKVRGARRDLLFINECNNVSFDVFEQLEVRTKEQVFLDYNPVTEFWVHQKIAPLSEATFIHSTYKDNDYLDPRIVRSIELRKKMPGMENWWRIYGMGQTGQFEGLIYTNWETVNEFPADCKWITCGLDFGFTNDPTACIKVGYYDGALWLDELFYDTNLTNGDICRQLAQSHLPPHSEIIADSAEPKSIEEIRRTGYHIKPAIKGRDSIAAGISLVKSYPLKITHTSTNIITELRNYSWQKNSNGQWLNTPIDSHNHAMDALRYAIQYKLNRAGIRVPTYHF